MSGTQVLSSGGQEPLDESARSETRWIRRRHRRAQAIIELIEFRPDGAGRPSKASDLDQLCRGYMRLGDQQMRNDGIERWETGSCLPVRGTGSPSSC